ncbi:MAG TPA: SPOR domain-containing protein [Bacteroidales bacterium]|nr:SPOR domain-containing protein [Bacteroidales bacterium]
MKVLQYISELLLQHDCVIVPGFGGFIATHIPAGIQPVINSFSPPRKEILFNSDIKHNDGLLASYIAQKENIPFGDALAMIQHFVEDCLQILNNKGKLEILHVGTLVLDSNNYFRFQQDMEHNLLLSSFGLANFISPAIQREGIEKRIGKVFSEKKIKPAEHKPSEVWAKVALISVPAAAVFVWAFVNVGTITDVTHNYTNLTSVFSVKENTTEQIVRSEKNLSYNIPEVYESTLDVANSKSIFTPRHDTLYPCFSEFSAGTTSASGAAQTETAVPASPCKFFIIGSCNRVRDLAENYKNQLISKGYQNAGIIEPKGNELYKVYIDCFDSEQTASDGLSRIHSSISPDAWLLKM